MTPQPQVLVGKREPSTGIDCACSESLPSDDIPFSSRTTASAWTRAPDLLQFPLEQDYCVYLNTRDPGAIAVLNRSAQELLASFCVPQPLPPFLQNNDGTSGAAAEAVRRLVDCRLLQPAIGADAPPCAPAATLSAWLELTSACNLRCSYCYVAKHNQRMSDETGRAAIDTLLRAAQQHGYRRVCIKYAGGEPTLCFDLVRRLHDYAMAQSRCTGVQVDEVLLSNGVRLRREYIDYLRRRQIGLMISLDGLEESHDRQRVKRNGTGSFADVRRAIDLCVKAGLHPDLSITVTRHNVAALREIAAFAIERDLKFNFNFYREHRCSTDHDSLAAADASLITGVRDALRLIGERLPSYRLLDGLLDRAYLGAAHSNTCGAGKDYLVIGANGAVSRCQMEMSHPCTTIDDADPLAAVRSWSQGMQPLPVAQKAGCAQCTWRQWCSGGCPLLTYRLTGDSSQSSPYCAVYQALLPEMVRLEGQRILKWEM